MKRGKTPDPERLRKRTERAMLTLRKSVITARQHMWITREQSTTLNDHLLHLEEILTVALHRTAPKMESEAILPFWVDDTLDQNSGGRT